MMLNALFATAFASVITSGAHLDIAEGAVIEAPPVVHQKEAGGGYKKGSPLHAQQEELKEKGELPSYPARLEDLTSGPKTVPPVSTTMKCIINLTVQYFLIYTAVAVVRTYNAFAPPAAQQKPLLQTLTAATATVNFAPMLSVLFLGARMRALQLSEGEPDKYDLPQPYVKIAMQCCAWSVLVQTLVVLALPLVLGHTPAVGQDGIPEVKTQSGGVVGIILASIRWITMALLYGGFTTVCVGAFAMDPPKELWPEGVPPVSPAVACTMNLAMQYFGVYLAIAVVQTWVQFNKNTAETHKLTAVLQLASNTVNFAPMLCILFIGARMRALQIDPKHGNPQAWAQYCFYLCAYSVLIQLLLVLAVPYVLGGTCMQGESEGDITFEVPNPTMYNVLTGVRYFVMAALYGGFTAVIVSVFTIEAPEGETTPAVSPAMQCVMNLTVQFFSVYLGLWVLITLKQLSLTWTTLKYDSLFAIWIPTFDAARATVQFAPMLSVLFVGLRMRALQITDQKGAPQGWAQQGMFLSTYAVLVQVLMVLLMPFFLGGPPKVDDDGNVISQPHSLPLAYTTVFVRYLALVCLYGGAVTVVVALFKITPETATGSGALIPGVEVPAPGL
jgi:hypothetical protein